MNKGSALVTGGAVRLGRCISLCLAELGYNIALHYAHSQAEAERAAQEIRAKGVRCEPFCCDFLDSDDTLELVRRVHSRFSDFNVLINSASVYEQKTIAETDSRFFDSHFAVNLKAPFFLTQQFAGICRAGHVINIIDTKVNFNQYAFAAYMLSKKSLLDFTRMASLEYAPDIRVNGISPGIILPAQSRPPDYIEWRRQALPLKRLGTPANILKAVAFLLENDFITGECITIDGGEAQSCVGENIMDYAAHRP